MNSRWSFGIFVVLVLFWTSINGMASIAPVTSDCSGSLCGLIREEVSKNFGGARVELADQIQWSRGEAIQNPTSITFLGDDSRGNAHVSVFGNPGEPTSEAWIVFSAWKTVKTSLKRIFPGERLVSDQFVSQSVNLAVGQAREYRGVIFPEQSELGNLEATQSILEGQFLMTTAVRKVPDVRRGDSVRIHLISGGLTLTTLGIAEEPSYISRQIRVITGKTKKELLGLLKPNGIVEVNL